MKKIDLFIQNYYYNWMNNTKELINSNIWTNKTLINLNGSSITSNKMIEFLNEYKKCMNKIENYQYITYPSHIELNVFLKLRKNNKDLILFQSFNLTHDSKINNTQIFVS